MRIAPCTLPCPRTRRPSDPQPSHPRTSICRGTQPKQLSCHYDLAVFQQMEVDYIIGQPMPGMDLNEKQRQVPIVRMYGVNEAGGVPDEKDRHRARWLCWGRCSHASDGRKAKQGDMEER